MQKLNSILLFDIILAIILTGVLIIHYANFVPEKWDESILTVIAYLATLPVFWSALKSLKNRKISIDLLASIALAVSLAEEQWTSVVFIALMITSARIFGDYTRGRSHSAIKSLLKLKPVKATVERNGKFIGLPIEKIKKGDSVIVDLGERIPVDGVAIKGGAEVDQSSLTGESVPVHKKIGDNVFTSTIVVSGNLIIRAEKVGEETTFAKVIKLVEESRKYKAEISTLSGKFSVWYIILTLVGSFLLYIFSKNVSLVLAVLLVSCADDIAVAVPLAFLTSIAHSAKHGVIIKGGDFLEALTKLKVAIVDKTGTLTRGKLKVEGIFAFQDKEPKEILEFSAALSLMSVHPSAQAIIKYAKGQKAAINEPERFEEHPGKGATAFYKNTEIISGKISFFKEKKIEITKHQLSDIEREKEKGLSVTLIGGGGKLLGFISLADEVRPEVQKSLLELENLGVKKIVMLTGDNEKIAKRVADSVGIREFHANLLPEDKIKYLKKYLSKDYKTAMIGDGVNDAAVLGLADIGIAMGTIGSDAAIESADIALMKDNLRQVPEVIKIGKSTLGVVRQDLWIWGIVNAVGLILVFARILGPDGAAAYNFVTDFLPLINSLRLFR
jgi:Cu+-exporting ATPase